MKIDPNMPAFPFPSGPEPRVNTYHDRAEGLTIRAHFAAMAMQGFITSPATLDRKREKTIEDIGVASVAAADALIAALNKDTP